MNQEENISKNEKEKKQNKVENHWFKQSLYKRIISFWSFMTGLNTGKKKNRCDKNLEEWGECKIIIISRF